VVNGLSGVGLVIVAAVVLVAASAVVVFVVIGLSRFRRARERGRAVAERVQERMVGGDGPVADHAAPSPAILTIEEAIQESHPALTNDPEQTAAVGPTPTEEAVTNEPEPLASSSEVGEEHPPELKEDSGSQSLQEKPATTRGADARPGIAHSIVSFMTLPVRLIPSLLKRKASAQSLEVQDARFESGWPEVNAELRQIEVDPQEDSPLSLSLSVVNSGPEYILDLSATVLHPSHNYTEVALGNWGPGVAGLAEIRRVQSSRGFDNHAETPQVLITYRDRHHFKHEVRYTLRSIDGTYEMQVFRRNRGEEELPLG